MGKLTHTHTQHAHCILECDRSFFQQTNAEKKGSLCFDTYHEGSKAGGLLVAPVADMPEEMNI